MIKKMTPLMKRLPLALALITTMSAHGQTQPDAGRVLQENRPAVKLPENSPAVVVELPPAADTTPGGVQVTLQSVSFSGNSRINADTLKQVLGVIKGKSYDLAGLRGLANEVTVYYREHGYPFARAYLPQQPLDSGALQIEIIEGRYGTVQAVGDPEMAGKAQPFLKSLQPGAVIESAPLERAALILDDQPGIHAIPVVRPGQEQGTGDLDVRIVNGPRIGGQVTVDNYGNRYTGSNRLGINLHYNDPFMLGDQFTLSAQYTDEQMWFGTLGYNLPLGTSGLRGQFSYTHTYYQLGQDFASLDATGTADVSSAGLSYPLIRSQQANLTLSAAYQHKDLNDQQGSVDSNTSKYSDSLPLTLSFDLRDHLGGGGVTYGSISVTTGRLHLDDTLHAVDQATAQTEGHFNKANLDIFRIQSLPAKFSLFAHLSAQWTNQNLDSSERFGLGGATGVRAYPNGEGYGDTGWLSQFEVRYDMGAFVPYIFYDAGRVEINANPWDTSNNSRHIAGPGIGLRYMQGPWNADLSAAWRSSGGLPESDTQDKDPRVWASVGYTF